MENILLKFTYWWSAASIAYDKLYIYKLYFNYYWGGV